MGAGLSEKSCVRPTTTAGTAVYCCVESAHHFFFCFTAVNSTLLMLLMLLLLCRAQRIRSPFSVLLFCCSSCPCCCGFSCCCSCCCVRVCVHWLLYFGAKSTTTATAWQKKDYSSKPHYPYSYNSSICDNTITVSSSVSRTPCLLCWPHCQESFAQESKKKNCKERRIWLHVVVRTNFV